MRIRRQNDIQIRLTVVFVCVASVLFVQFLGANVSFQNMDKKNENNTTIILNDTKSFTASFNAFPQTVIPLQTKYDPKIELARFLRILDDGDVKLTP